MRDSDSNNPLFLTENYDKNDEYAFVSMYDDSSEVISGSEYNDNTYLDSAFETQTEISSLGSESVQLSIDHWDDETLMNRIIDIYEKNYKNYETCNLHKFKGSKLSQLNVEFYVDADPDNGKWLYGKVQELLLPSEIVSYYTFQTESNINISQDCKTTDSEPVKIKRQRGRPKLSNKIRKKPEHRTGKLWEFIRDLLHNPKYCPMLIMWEDHKNGVFRFVSSDKVAKLWGSMRGNAHMNYEKLSRAMRYYYKTEVFQPVYGKRLVYSFGKKAKGWQTSNPNFEINEL